MKNIIAIVTCSFPYHRKIKLSSFLNEQNYQHLLSKREKKLRKICEENINYPLNL